MIFIFFYKFKRIVFYVYKNIVDVCVYFFIEEVIVEKRILEEDSEEVSSIKKVKKDEVLEVE